MTDFEPGSPCPAPDCDGVLDIGTPEGCSCHISAPCSACENAGCECPECGFDSADEWKAARRDHWEDEAESRERLTAVKRGTRRDETTHTHVANPFNSTPFTDCCGAASFGSRCVICEAQIIGHRDPELDRRRREAGPGNCLMCGKRRGDPAISGNCHC